MFSESSDHLHVANSSPNPYLSLGLGALRPLVREGEETGSCVPQKGTAAPKEEAACPVPQRQWPT